MPAGAFHKARRRLYNGIVTLILPDEKRSSSQMRAYLRCIAGAVLLATVAGCGPAIPPDELGHVVYGEKNLPKPKEPYVLAPAPPAPPGAPPAKREKEQ